MTMKHTANGLLGLGLAMLAAYFVIGLRAGAAFVHHPFVMFVGGVVLVLGGWVGRFVLPRL
ncbi:hypothetical protein SAMN02949497_3234 [Methylomagnum ishizawai]|uniref:Uncharacterized protein n=1 Tax=Methylomagnum ishizawai TaxID=1760988 RepID=A0A1Y6CYW2_9GAMM|nr:hypothetical protein [Methylomagnum ishizawai]SMF95859.1 hypothetical protein SAMN02949497_3234 [Methylomagnum ishizawai]